MVRITGLGHCTPEMEYTTVEVPFKDYVKGVLPSEWGANWPEESLKAGAIAVKMYGWASYESKGYVWDCNYDQVYRPWYTTAATDKAVDDTWGWILVDKDGIVKTYYDDWPAACNSRTDHNCMSQWITLEKAENGATWASMIRDSYNGILIWP